MTSVDPVLQEDEVVELRAGGDWHTFRAGVREDESGIIVLSPVPERVRIESVGVGVYLHTESVDDGEYLWADHDLTAVGTQIVRLRPIGRNNGGSSP